MNAKNFYVVILIGGGHSNIQVVKSWMMNRPQNAKLILISSLAYAPYSGMIPMFLKGEYNFEQIHFDLRKICSIANVDFIEDSVTSVDSKLKRVFFKNRPSIKFDIASINVGITPKFVIDKQSNVIFLKPIRTLINKVQDYNQKIKDLSLIKTPSVAFIGGGSGGVEVAIMLKLKLKQENINAIFCIYQRGQSLLKGHNKRASKIIESKLKDLNIDVKYGIEVSGYKNGSILAKNNFSKSYDFIFVSTDAKAPSLLENSDLKLSQNGFLEVNQYLQTSCKSIFAAGDCIEFKPQKLLKSGVFAVRQGPIITNNIFSLIDSSWKIKKYKPQKSALALIHSGEETALFSKGNIVCDSKLFLILKKYIDQKFMNNFSTNFFERSRDDSFVKFKKTGVMDSAMQDNFLRDDEINTCCGCGSKISPNLLFDTLNSDSFLKFKKILPFVHDDSPHLLMDRSKLFEVNLCSSIDEVRSFINDPYLFGKIAALHALSDIAASGSKPLYTNLTLAIKHNPEKILKYEFEQCMHGICEVLSKHNVKIIKGHSTEAKESSVCLSVIGSCSFENNLSDNKLELGDKIILCKPLGTGILLRALMLGFLSGDDADQLLENLLLDNLDLVDLLARKRGVGVVTDVTGYSLVGHSIEMLHKNNDSSNQLAIEFDWEKLPVLKGVDTLLKQNIESHLIKKLISFYKKYLDNEFDLISRVAFDPQTNGGLLISVKSNQASTLLDQIHLHGFRDACIIATVIQREKTNVLLR